MRLSPSSQLWQSELIPARPSAQVNLAPHLSSLISTTTLLPLVLLLVGGRYTRKDVKHLIFSYN